MSNFCKGQNYQCLQNGVKHYFINENNYLRGISIDSVQTISGAIVYFPYKTTRYSSLTKKGSWLGGRVLQSPDGTFSFDDIWGDTVVIKTLANTGDTWLFYSDTLNHTYIAKVTSVDTMTILGAVDSVKNVVINSYHSGLADVTDSLNNFNILLSKNNGFIKIFDLYTFPYYSPSAGYYVAGNDRYLDYVSHGPSGYGPQAGNAEFSIVPYHNPTSLEMYNFSAGDLFAGNYGTWTNCTNDYVTNYSHSDSVLYKTIVDSFHVNYAMHHLISGTHTYLYDSGSSSSFFTEDYVDTLHTDTSLVFLTRMPEEYTVADLVYYYYPADTSFCH